jgi:hypothetical protein
MATLTKTVVFTDIANYTLSTAKANREELRKLIQDHEDHTNELFRPYGGKLVKNLGDSFMAIFDSASAAVRASMEIVETTLTIGNQELAIRASLCTGDVEEIAGDYFGEAVNLSARINSKVPAGECWFANRTRLCMNQKEIPWETVGVFDFKGIPDSIECYRAVPPSQCILPDDVAKLARLSILQIITPDTPPRDRYTREDTILLKGFKLGSRECDDIVGKLPSTVAPSQVYLLETTIPGLERKEWLQKGYQLIIGTEEAFDKVVTDLQNTAPVGGSSQTLFMDFGSSSDVSIEMVGLAIRNPIPNLIVSYSYDLLSNGAWGFGPNPLLKVEIQPQGSYLSAYVTGLSVNGRSIQPGVQETLTVECQINTPIGQLIYKPVSNRDYRGIIIGKNFQSMESMIGDRVEFGREPDFPGFTLKERSSANGVVWAPGPRAQQARHSGYTLDRVIIGRKQAHLQIIANNNYLLTAIHQRIPTFAFVDGNLVMITAPQQMKDKDLFVIGTCLLQVGPA